jgi:hypothetical protein
MDIIPVPTYYPEVKEILGKPVVRDLKQVRQPHRCLPNMCTLLLHALYVLYQAELMIQGS